MIPASLRRPIIVTALIIVLGVAWTLWSSAAADRKLRTLPSGDRPVDVVITLRFAPESFHLTRAQDIGQVVKTDGDDLYVRGVARPALHEYARAFWVRAVNPWPSR